MRYAHSAFSFIHAVMIPVVHLTIKALSMVYRLPIRNTTTTTTTGSRWRAFDGLTGSRWQVGEDGLSNLTVVFSEELCCSVFQILGNSAGYFEIASEMFRGAVNVGSCAALE